MSPNAKKIFNLLRDGKPHYSAEFRDSLRLLEYRKRISEIRKEGYQIVSMKYRDSLLSPLRPAYRLLINNSEAA